MNDEIREQVARALYEQASAEHADESWIKWHECDEWFHRPYRRSADALMPLIREAQAEAWDQGLICPGMPEPVNPYRTDPTPRASQTK